MKKSNTLGIITGLGFIYLAIYLFLGVGTNNMAYKDNNFINKSIAAIKIYENSGNNTEYFTGSNDIYDDKWTSGEYPNGSYSKASIMQTTENIVPEDITTSVSYISRSSH